MKSVPLFFIRRVITQVGRNAGGIYVKSVHEKFKQKLYDHFLYIYIIGANQQG
jgi:hypothetical protein